MIHGKGLFEENPVTQSFSAQQLMLGSAGGRINLDVELYLYAMLGTVAFARSGKDFLIRPCCSTVMQ